MRETRRNIRNAGIHAARLRLSAGLGLTVLLVLLCGPAGRSQSSGSNGSSGGNGGNGNMHPYSHRDDIDSTTDSDLDPMTNQRRIHALNFQRQKQMVSDTDKLLKLARELNEEVAAQNTGTLTLDELHKVTEIEKLARNVRQRMTEAVGQPLSNMQMSPQPPTIYPNH